LTRCRWPALPGLAKPRTLLCRIRTLSYLCCGVVTIVLQQGAAVGVDVGVGVFDFTHGAQHGRDGFEAESGQIADVIVFDVSLGKRFQMRESRVSVPQNGVAVARNDSAFAEGLPHKFLNDYFAGLLSFVVVFEFAEPFEALLVGQAMKRAGEAVHGGREGKVGVGEG